MARYESPYDPSKSPKNLEHVHLREEGPRRLCDDQPARRCGTRSTRYAYAELRSCWRDIGLDPDIYVGIVTGTGDAFCAGRDVKFLAKYQDAGQAHAARGSEQPAVPLGRRRPAAATSIWRSR